MPMFEALCHPCNLLQEFYLPKWDEPNPPCCVCGGPTERMFSTFGVVFTGPITARYNDPKRENAHQDGYWAYRRVSSLSGQPEPVFIDNWDAAREFNKAEGLAAPGEVPSNSTISPDGRRILSDGLPGQWARGGMSVRDMVPSRVWEMDQSLTSLSGKDPAPVAGGPPCTGGAADAKLMETFTAVT